MDPDHDDLVAWQNRGTWDPFAFDPGTPVWPATVSFGLAIVNVSLNGVAVATATRVPSFTRTPANTIAISICAGNILFGVFVAAMHAHSLVAGRGRSEGLCRFESVVNQFCISLNVCLLLNLSLERYSAVLLQKPLSQRMAWMGVANAVVISAACALAPIALGIRPVISTTGLYCFPNYIHAIPVLQWTGLVNIVALNLNIWLTFGVFLFISRKLRATRRELERIESDTWGAQSGTTNSMTLAFAADDTPAPLPDVAGSRTIVRSGVAVSSTSELNSASSASAADVSASASRRGGGGRWSVSVSTSLQWRTSSPSLSTTATLSSSLNSLALHPHSPSPPPSEPAVGTPAADPSTATVAPITPAPAAATATSPRRTSKPRTSRLFTLGRRSRSRSRNDTHHGLALARVTADERVLMRGVITLFAFTLNWVPLLTQLLYNFSTDRRAPAAIDTVVCLLAGFAPISDPIILLAFDGRLRGILWAELARPTMSHHHHHHNGCGHEAHDHDHSGGGHDGHDHDGPDRGAEYSLWQYVDVDRVRALNESVEGAAKSVFRPWDQRLDDSKFVESDADEQLIIFIPFTGQVKLKAIALRAPLDESAPAEMRAFINVDGIDFDAAESTEPTQAWDLVAPADIQASGEGDVVEYPTKLTKFGALRSLTLFIPRNFGADTSVLRFIGLRGDFTPLNRDPIITMYEAAANPADHAPIVGLDSTNAYKPGM
ncbi:hypothetical protein H9P43_003959 [Blastocladiella emersonii ATCC 22665]|nr:hypothetical protein H9P43_003959 [Blastocladiella emersonii ATCC 22665]